MTVWTKKSPHNRNAIVATIIFLFSISFAVWNIIDGYLFAKSLFLFPSFHFDEQKGLLFLTIIPFIVLCVLFSMLIISKIHKHFSKIVFVLSWIFLVASAILLMVMSLLFSFTLSHTCNSETSDLDNYMVFDSAVEHDDIVEIFPSKDQVDYFIANDIDVSYEYILNPGMFDSESTYSVVLTVSKMNEEQYQAIKNELIKTYGQVLDNSQENATITVKNHKKTDLDGYDFFICSSVTFDEKNLCILYSVSKYYP